MSPSKTEKLFESILRDFNNNEILQDFILIGSWVLRVYKEYFENDPEIPIVATQDLDLLLSNPPKISHKVDVSQILSRYELEAVYSPMGNYSKFVSPDFEVEFLYPAKGSGETGGKTISELGITATPLRYLSFIESFTKTMEYKSIPVRVPEPTVFVLMKYLLVKKRKAEDVGKIAKDLSTAQDLEFFLLERGYRDDFLFYYDQMPKKWKKDLLKILEENESELFDLLKDNTG